MKLYIHRQGYARRYWLDGHAAFEMPDGLYFREGSQHLFCDSPTFFETADAARAAAVAMGFEVERGEDR